MIKKFVLKLKLPMRCLLKLKYMDDTHVLICNHDNLRDRKYRQKRDNLHLTEAGTSRLANNLKYKIAESLNIQVVKKKRSDYTGRFNINNLEHHNSTNRLFWGSDYHNRDRNQDYSRYVHYPNKEGQHGFPD